MNDPTREALPEEDLRPVLEAILIVSPTPVTVEALSEATGVDAALVEETLTRLENDFNGGGEQPQRGFTLRQVEGGWRFYSRAEYAPWVGRFVTGEHMATLSQAALETLAVIAYRQPVTRSQVSAVRGVNVDGVVRTLLARGLVEEEGVGGGGAGLLHTTDLFLEKMGLESLGDLPPLAPHMADPSEAGALAEELL